jgi:bacterioferritin
MGKLGIEIIGIDKNELIRMLDEALSEEWLAYYQYWIGARVMEGPMRSEIAPELLLHATQELGHAVLVVDRIIQLGGIPVLNPADWMKLSSCEYEVPVDPYVGKGVRSKGIRKLQISRMAKTIQHTRWQPPS